MGYTYVFMFVLILDVYFSVVVNWFNGKGCVDTRADVINRNKIFCAVVVAACCERDG